jgi:hypothetical protein
MISFTEINRQPRYSFRLPVNLLSLAIDELATHYLLGSSTSAIKSPLRYPLFAPNSAVGLRLYSHLKLTVATNTEYVFYRLHNGERGVLFVPQIGLEWSGDKDDYDYGGIILTVGKSEFWNFDGPDRDYGVTARIELFFNDNT